MPPKIRVALLFGGRSAEHDVSISSAAGVYANLDPRRYDVRPVYITRQGLWRPSGPPDPGNPPPADGGGFPFLPWSAATARPGAGGVPEVEADIYFPVLHGPFGEDGTIQGMLEMADVPYVGCGVLASSLSMDKAETKLVLRARGIPVVPFEVVREAEWAASRRRILAGLKSAFPFPVFVKPANLGSSVGITKVKAASRLAAALDLAFSYDRKVVVERGIDGMELECSVLGNDAPEASVPGQVIPGREFYDYADKYLRNETTFVVPAPLPAAAAARVRALAVAAFLAVEGSGLARVDFFRERRSGRVFVNEINTLPGFTAISLYPRLWAATGLATGPLVDRLIDLGFERHRARKRNVSR